VILTRIGLPVLPLIVFVILVVFGRPFVKRIAYAIGLLSCLSVLSDTFLLKFWLQVTYPLMIAASLDTFCLVAPQR